MSKINTKDFLSTRGITFKEQGEELITQCFFNDCDKDSKGAEAHLYFSTKTGQYDCKKCGAKGNLATLAKHLGEEPEERPKYKRGETFDEGLVEKCHANLPDRIRAYLNSRGISNEVINAYKLGYGIFRGKKFITIPIADSEGYKFFKLRQDPEDGDIKTTYPGGNAQLFGEYANGGHQIICEGEMDALALISKGFPALTSTHGANTFKEEWCDDRFKGSKGIYVCYDNDKAGRDGSIKVLNIFDRAGFENLYQVSLPEEVGEAGDITDFLTKLNISPDELLTTLAKPFPEAIDPSQFKPMTGADIAKVLDLTIKKDDDNKVITLLCCATAYTEDSQTNLSFNAPSSTGKSYTALEVAKLFPPEDVIKLANCSRNAFFHEQGVYDKEKNQMTIDFARKILIFTDMPHSGLLEKLRSFLSHDEKLMISKITDKGDKGGNRTKTVILKGYASVVFCSAGLKMDPQELTRFILLNPEISQEKIRAGIINTISKETDSIKYEDVIDKDADRKLLKLRLRAIKQAKINDIKLGNEEMIQQYFLSSRRYTQPRHQRDVKKLISLIKAFALMNLWWRERSGKTIIANEADMKEAFALWDRISPSHDLNIPPYIHDIYTKVIVPAYKEKNNVEEFGDLRIGVTRMEILKKHSLVLRQPLGMDMLRNSIIPCLESAGLITFEKDKEDGRKE
ncbi:MAG: toprim domain-containing protein, partial [bacterium]